MGVSAHAGDEAELMRLARRVMDRFTARCATRAAIRDQLCAVDGEWTKHADEVLCSEIVEGTLAKAREGLVWTLLLDWRETYGARMLTHGSREHVERFALEVTLHGPPGGPEFWNQRAGWCCTSDDNTLHAVTVGGEFRLMPLVSGQHLLMFAGNDDGGVRVLDIGDSEELQRTAHERLQRDRGETLYVRVGEQRVVLRVIAAAGVLGQVDAVGGDQLVLGHLAGDEFGLLRVRDQNPLECIRRYSLSELRRGDLGQVLTWNHQASAADDALQEDPPCAAPSTRSDPAPPAPAKPERAVQPPRSPQPQAHVAKLSATDLAVVDQHLTFDEPVTGDGATMVPPVFKGLRALVRHGVPNLLLYGCPLKKLMKAHGVEIHCCDKTFGRAMKLAAAQMQASAPLSDCLLIKVGRRWFLRTGDLRLVGSALLRCIATAVIDKAMSSPPAARTPAPADLDTEAAAPRVWGTRSFDEPPPAADPPSDLGGDTREEISPTQVESQEAGATPHGAEKPQEFDLAWFLAQQAQPPAPTRRRRLRDRPRIITLASLPIHLSPSQWPGVQTARGPPGEEDE